MEYIVLLLLINICAFSDIFVKDEKYKKYIYIGLMVAMVIFAGTRFKTGNDWWEYTDTFHKVPTISQIIKGDYNIIELRMEKGYLFTNVFVKSLGGGINEVFLLMAFLTIGLIFICNRKYTPLTFLAVALYMRYGYIQANMMFMRQGFTVAIFLYSLKYIYNEELIKYMLCMVVCILFHKSSIVLVPMYFILDRKYSNKFIIGLVVVSIVLAMFDWIKFITLITPSNIDYYINNYLNSGVWGGKSVVSSAVIEKLIVIFIGLKFRDVLEQKNKYFNIFFNTYLVSFIVYYAFLQQYIFQQRISFFFNISGIILITYYALLINSKKLKIITYVCLLMVINVFTLKSIAFFSEESSYLPYKSYVPMYIENFIDSIGKH